MVQINSGAGEFTSAAIGSSSGRWALSLIYSHITFIPQKIIFPHREEYVVRLNFTTFAGNCTHSDQLRHKRPEYCHRLPLIKKSANYKIKINNF